MIDDKEQLHQVKREVKEAIASVLDNIELLTNTIKSVGAHELERAGSMRPESADVDYDDYAITVIESAVVDYTEVAQKSIGEVKSLMSSLISSEDVGKKREEVHFLLNKTKELASTIAPSFNDPAATMHKEIKPFYRQLDNKIRGFARSFFKILPNSLEKLLIPSTYKTRYEFGSVLGGRQSLVNMWIHSDRVPSSMLPVVWEIVHERNNTIMPWDLNPREYSREFFEHVAIALAPSNKDTFSSSLKRANSEGYEAGFKEASDMYARKIQKLYRDFTKSINAISVYSSGKDHG